MNSLILTRSLGLIWSTESIQNPVHLFLRFAYLFNSKHKLFFFYFENLKNRRI